MIRQVLKGDGIAFIGAMGVLTHKVLAPGEKLIVDTCVETKIYGAFVLNHRVVLHAVDATPARCRSDAGSSPLDGASTAAPPPRSTRRTG